MCTRVFHAPAESLTNVCVCFYFSPDIVFCLLEYLRLKESHISGEKKSKKDPFVNGSAGAYKTRVQNCRVYLSKTAWTCGRLCGKRAKIMAPHRNYLVSVQKRFWALNIT